MPLTFPTDFPIDPTTTSGTTLAEILNRFEAAVFSSNASLTAPTDTYPGMQWLDTSGGGNGVLKVRDGTNTGWITLMNMNTGQGYLPLSGGTLTGLLALTKPGAQVEQHIKGDSGQAAMLALAGNGVVPGVASFDLTQDAAGAYLNQRANAPLAFLVNAIERLRLSTAAATLSLPLSVLGAGVASRVAANVLQLGEDATATRNLTFRTNADGTFTLARGNAGATTQDILTIDANGRVLMPQSYGPCFRARRTTVLAVPGSTPAKVTMTVEDFDKGNCFDAATSRFVPSVAGHYHISYAVTMDNGPGNSRVIYSGLMLNGLATDPDYAQGSQIFASPYDSGTSVGTELLYLVPGDWIELWARGQVVAGGANVYYARFSAFYVRPA